jgi:hypothetical protein
METRFLMRKVNPKSYAAMVELDKSVMSSGTPLRSALLWL